MMLPALAPNSGMRFPRKPQPQFPPELFQIPFAEFSTNFAFDAPAVTRNFPKTENRGGAGPVTGPIKFVIKFPPTAFNPSSRRLFQNFIKRTLRPAVLTIRPSGEFHATLFVHFLRLNRGIELI